MKPRKILIIEDEPEIRLILGMCLRHSGGFEPILACDGIEGMELARKHLPDLILLDAVMPKLDGYTTCRRMKQEPALREIPIIFLTAKTDRREVTRAIRAGACGCLSKPFEPLELAGRIASIIEESVSRDDR
jgi:CheY-like chemotaxis protein